MLQTRLKRLEGERKEREAGDKERKAELVRLKLVVAEAEKVRHLAALTPDTNCRDPLWRRSTYVAFPGISMCWTIGK